MRHKTIFNVFKPADQDRASKDKNNRLTAFLKWATEYQVDLEDPNLMHQYADYLERERGLSKNSVRVHVSTVRSHFHKRLDDGSVKRALIRAGVSPSEADVHIGRLWQALYKKRVKIKPKETKKRNKNLNDEHRDQVLDSADTSELIGLRDLLVMVLMLIFGLREHEVCALNVEDFYQGQASDPILHVREGFGCTERDIPYRDDAWAQNIATKWLEETGIAEGAAIRGFYKSGQKLRDNRLSPRAVERLLANYPVIIGDEPVVLKPLDLRHAYARHQYRSGVPIEVIQEHLGLKTRQPVIDYLGNALDVNAPSRPYEFDLSRLDQLEGDANE